MKKILHVIGARPNFAKAAPIISELRKNKRVKQTVVHTGQHFDENMSLSFLKQLGIGKPNYQLSLSSKTPVSQVSEISCKLEEIIKKVKPHIVMAYGDVNSALAAALVCKDIDVKLAHVEAGLRSHDKAMPEETNRIIIDHLSDIH
ncbi:UDP-N-acetylglucosamine 2-epimerase (non-hydrolyzing), partial [Candidatus Pacearchaeota archaeon]|nr:UDP-N-acetylglucosamine 2-epimerase (non-hydrolyzing) [Candidatus Pacearchaeota archaeon]